MPEQDFKEKARRHLFNCGLREFPVVFEMYVRSFNLDIDLDKTMGEMVSIIRTSENQKVAYSLVCHYLDGLES